MFLSLLIFMATMAYIVAMSSLNEDRLLEELVQLNKHNLHNIPVAEVGEIIHVELGLVLKKIIKVVRQTVIIWA